MSRNYGGRAGKSAMLAMHGNGWSAALLQELAPMKAVANGVADAQQQLKDSGMPLERRIWCRWA